MRPMSEFDPSKPAILHDSLNDDTFEWLPEKHGPDWEKYPPIPWAPGVVNSDGLLLDGWEPLPAG